MTESVTVRPARPDDAAFAVPLIQATIGHIGLALTGAATDAEAQGVMLEFFVRPGNRLSFQNVWIAERSGEALGFLLGYAGVDSEALDEPFREHLRGRNLPGNVVSEGQHGEWYVDTLAVTGAARGHGVGARLLQEAPAQATAQGLDRVGLLVEHGNRAAKLYLRQGFEVEAERVLGGHAYDHMIHRI
ncbi:GNAT family N-acetyltransferase [Deinococcus arenicola]|uniref:GNAT family N-acetyltransferase n=1 Tax=Deinococcus arenicola TaxID=2994950 RepID=A0ABU4DQW7_9DEIO|nr:GNAT family N-acetyltransferase [Deinococcus sp. ZS9-10]MDV6374831.1 GNAT family N-acetyltransferase [Deinococcus sp. ZS9-10]